MSIIDAKHNVGSITEPHYVIDVEHVQRFLDELRQAIGLQKTNHITSGSIGPLYSAGFAAGCTHAAGFIEKVLERSD